MTERDWQKDWEMCEKATPGPWCTVDGGEVYPVSGPTAYVALCRIVGPWEDSSWYDKDVAEANGKFIAAAREALPYWLKRVRELEEENKRLRTVAEAARKLRQFERNPYNIEPGRGAWFINMELCRRLDQALDMLGEKEASPNA